MPLNGLFITSRKGFTLIELALVLVIIGILVSLGAGMIGPLNTMVKLRETRESMDADLQSVISWATSNNKVPTWSEFSTNVAKSSNDAWGRPFVFLYYSSLAPTSATKDTICGRRSTFLNISTLEPKVYVKNVAFAVVSRADNTNFTSKVNGTAVASGATPDNQYHTLAANGPNSDLIRWVTLDELRGKVGCQGAPLKILNNELPFSASANYSATLTADGGVPFSSGGAYKWCVEFASRPGLSGFVVVPDTALMTGCSSSAEGSYLQSDTLNLIKKASSFGNLSTGTYKLTVYVRDNAGNDTLDCKTTTDNCVQKPFVITINPN